MLPAVRGGFVNPPAPASPTVLEAAAAAFWRWFAPALATDGSCGVDGGGAGGAGGGGGTGIVGAFGFDNKEPMA